MKREFIETPSFTKRWYDLGFDDEDLAELQTLLINNSEAGVIVSGTGGLRKIRYSFKGRGKSGSSRVCYVDFASYEKTYLIQVFSKNEKSNLTDNEKNSIKKVISLLKTDISKNWEKKHE